MLIFSIPAYISRFSISAYAESTESAAVSMNSFVDTSPFAFPKRIALHTAEAAESEKSK